MALEKVTRQHFCAECHSDIKRISKPTAFLEEWKCSKCGSVDEAYCTPDNLPNKSLETHLNKYKR